MKEYDHVTVLAVPHFLGPNPLYRAVGDDPILLRRCNRGRPTSHATNAGVVRLSPYAHVLGDVEPLHCFVLGTSSRLLHIL